MTAPITTWLAEPLPADVRGALARVAAAPDVVRVAVMPDVHLGRDVCVGSVIATRRRILPSAIGGDLGCGVATVRLGGDAGWLADRRLAAAVLDGLARAVPSRRHVRDVPPLPAALAAPMSDRALDVAVRRLAASELGTLGGGNHFLELQRDAQDRVWMMIHTGSRGMGQVIRDHHVARADTRSGPLAWLDADTDAGRAYLADVAWALAYADANRRAITAAAARVLRAVVGVGPEPATYVACHHNYVRAEPHDGERLWVHRKGAISAADGEPGLIPGSMGTASYHVRGRGHALALCSAAHGAGRRLSRGDARRAISVAALDQQMAGVWFDRRLAASLCDEAPRAYKPIDRVMRAQAELVAITRELRPRLSFKGGA